MQVSLLDCLKLEFAASAGCSLARVKLRATIREEGGQGGGREEKEEGREEKEGSREEVVLTGCTLTSAGYSGLEV